MKKLNAPIEYRTFVIKQENDWLVLYDKYGNFYKKNLNYNHGSLTDLKHLADKYISEGTIK